MKEETKDPGTRSWLRKMMFRRDIHWQKLRNTAFAFSGPEPAGRRRWPGGKQDMACSAAGREAEQVTVEYDDR